MVAVELPCRTGRALATRRSRPGAGRTTSRRSARGAAIPASRTRRMRGAPPSAAPTPARRGSARGATTTSSTCPGSTWRKRSRADPAGASGRPFRPRRSWVAISGQRSFTNTVVAGSTGTCPWSAVTSRSVSPSAGMLIGEVGERVEHARCGGDVGVGAPGRSGGPSSRRRRRRRRRTPGRAGAAERFDDRAGPSGAAVERMKRRAAEHGPAEGRVRDRSGAGRPPSAHPARKARIHGVARVERGRIEAGRAQGLALGVAGVGEEERRDDRVQRRLELEPLVDPGGAHREGRCAASSYGQTSSTGTATSAARACRRLRRGAGTGARHGALRTTSRRRRRQPGRPAPAPVERAEHAGGEAVLAFAGQEPDDRGRDIGEAAAAVGRMDDLHGGRATRRGRPCAAAARACPAAIGRTAASPARRRTSRSGRARSGPRVRAP